MAEKPEDFNMPSAVVSKLMKDALPEGVIVSRDVRSASSRAASIFILYLTTCANTIASNNKRKTLTAQDVIDAISSMGFDEFLPQLIRWHDSYRKEKAKKEKLKAKKVAQNLSNQRISQISQHNKEDNEDEDDEEYEDLESDH